MKSKFCFKCKLIISDDEDYFKFVEYREKKIVATDYAHKVCWNEIKGDLNLKVKAMGMLDQMKETMIREGIIKPKQIEVEIR